MEMDNSGIIETQVEDKLIEVGLAGEFQEAIVSSGIIEFKKEELKNKILGADKKQLLVVTSMINSPKLIEEVKFYDEEFLMNAL